MITGTTEAGVPGNKAVIDEIATFVRVVRHGSLAGAARELSVPKSTVSRRLKRLEEVLQVRLLHRGPRKFTLSSEGKQLFDNVHASIEQVELAIHSALEGGTMPRGHIRITAPEDFGRLLLLDELRAFAELWPDISFEVDLSNRFVDMVQEGYDLAIRATPAFVVPGSESLVTRKLVTSKLQLAGSAASTKQVDSLDDLKGQPFVLFRQPSLRQELELTTTSGRRQRLAVEGRFVVHDYGSMAALVAQGAGYGLLPRMHIEYSRSALRCILPKLYVDTRDIALVYPSRQLPRRVSLLIEHLSRKLGDL